MDLTEKTALSGPLSGLRVDPGTPQRCQRAGGFLSFEATSQIGHFFVVLDSLSDLLCARMYW